VSFTDDQLRLYAVIAAFLVLTLLFVARSLD